MKESPDPAGEHAGPRVVRAVHAGADLENVVGSAETPLEVIVSEDGVAILEFLGVAVGLLGLVLVGVIDRPGVVIQVVVALGWLVAQVVPLGVGVLSEVAHGRVSQHSLKKTHLHLLPKPTMTCELFCIIFNNYIINHSQPF